MADEGEESCVPCLVQLEGQSAPVEIMLPVSVTNSTEALQMALAESNDFVEISPEDSAHQLPELTQLNVPNTDVPMESIPQMEQAPAASFEEKPVVEHSNCPMTITINMQLNTSEQIDVNMSVATENFEEYLPFFGLDVLVFCKVCNYRASSFQDLVEHIERGTCKTGEVAKIEDHGNGDVDRSTLFDTTDESKPQSRKRPRDDYIMDGPPPMTFESDGGKFTCNLCPMTLMLSSVEQEYHLLCHKKATEYGAFSCSECPFEEEAAMTNTRQWRHVKEHLHKKHQVDFQLSCNECNDVFTNHAELYDHQKVHRVSCHLCSFSSIKQSDIDAHVLCHSASKKFCCFVCNFVSPKDNSKWSLMHKHLVDSHPGSIEPLHKCMKCMRGYTTIRQFVGHVEKCKGNPKSSQSSGSLEASTCPICQLGIEMSNLASHTRECIETNQSSLYAEMQEAGIVEMPDESKEDGRSGKNSDGSELLFCKNHKLQCDSVSSLVQHYVLKHIKCPSDESNNDEDFENVKQEAEEGSDDGSSKEDASEEHKCYHCYRKFTSKLRLMRHNQRVHSEERLKPVPCSTCGKCFKNKNRLRNHVREVHEGKRRIRPYRPPKKPYGSTIFICDQCGYVTPSKERLKNHRLSVHEGILPFKCPWCEYRTSERADLYRHKMRHTGDKKYTCEYCAYQCNERWILINHCNNKHDMNLPRLHRNTRGLPGSLKWRKEMERQKRKAALQEVTEEPVATETNLEYVKAEVVTDDTMEEVILPMTVIGENQQVVYIQDGDETNTATVYVV